MNPYNSLLIHDIQTNIGYHNDEESERLRIERNRERDNEKLRTSQCKDYGVFCIKGWLNLVGAQRRSNEDVLCDILGVKTYKGSEFKSCDQLNKEHPFLGM